MLGARLRKKPLPEGDIITFISRETFCSLGQLSRVPMRDCEHNLVQRTNRRKTFPHFIRDKGPSKHEVVFRTTVIDIYDRIYLQRDTYPFTYPSK